MAKIPGFNTKLVAEGLKDKLDAGPLRFKGIKLFYDHGSSSKAEVCQPTAYMGRRYGRDATLAAVDIVVTKGKEVLLAIEIEESVVRPKTVLGDIFAIAIAERMRIQGKPYSIKDTTIVVALAEEGKGKKSDKYVRLERHLNRYFKGDPSGRVKKIRIIPCPIDDLVRRIERIIRLEIGKLNK